jgi:hypothetical protein
LSRERERFERRSYDFAITDAKNGELIGGCGIDRIQSKKCLGDLYYPVILPRLGRIYHTGLYELSGHFVYTGRGLGMVGLPLRFNCPPDLSEINLEAA